MQGSRHHEGKEKCSIIAKAALFLEGPLVLISTFSVSLNHYPHILSTEIATATSEWKVHFQPLKLLKSLNHLLLNLLPRNWMKNTCAVAASLLGIEAFLFFHQLLVFLKLYFLLMSHKVGLCIMSECMRALIASATKIAGKKFNIVWRKMLQYFMGRNYGEEIRWILRWMNCLISLLFRLAS